ncbi:hypothetical protein ZHAS_00015544 [Anopheles sinensis]|uniref:Uncharacterized protein n=1 Tax=Anopheles sinensis TaxID=74873 RepID=A0A084WBI3_ANOSI|nr:hypothetical protein ZHAS_00015544 [Anopheles sinensis]
MAETLPVTSVTLAQRNHHSAIANVKANKQSVQRYGKLIQQLLPFVYFTALPQSSISISKEQRSKQEGTAPENPPDDYDEYEDEEDAPSQERTVVSDNSETNLLTKDYTEQVDPGETVTLKCDVSNPQPITSQAAYTSHQSPRNGESPSGNGICDPRHFTPSLGCAYNALSLLSVRSSSGCSSHSVLVPGLVTVCHPTGWTMPSARRDRRADKKEHDSSSAGLLIDVRLQSVREAFQSTAMLWHMEMVSPRSAIGHCKRKPNRSGKSVAPRFLCLGRTTDGSSIC